MKALKKIVGAVLACSLLLSAAGCSLGGGLTATSAALNNSDFYAKYYTDQKKYDYLLEGFNLTDEQKIHYLQEYNYLMGVKLCVEVVNKTDEDIRVIGLEIKDNGKNETLISTTPRAVVEIPAKTETPQKVWFDAFADGGEYTNDELFEMAKDMGLKLIYVDASTGIESLSVADEQTLKYEKVK